MRLQPRHRHGLRQEEDSDDADEDGLELPTGEDGQTLGPEDLVVLPPKTKSQKVRMTHGLTRCLRRA